MGRPSTFTPEIAAAICERLAAGESLRAICRDESMPPWQTVYAWIAKDEAFSLRITHAREIGSDAIAEDIMDIIDDGSNDWMEKHDREGNAVGWQLNGEHVQRSKLRAETRLKLLAKWFPKKYGDKQTLEHTGPDSGPVQLEHKADRIAELMTLAAARKAKVEEDIEGLV